MIELLGAELSLLLAPTPSPSPSGGSSGACPAAPPGVQGYADELLGWVKWGVLALLALSFFASIGMLIWGRVTHHPKGARLGFDGLMICIVGAILYAVGYVLITSITGSGC